MAESRESFTAGRAISCVAACVLATVLAAPAAAQSPSTSPSPSPEGTSAVREAGVDAVAVLDWSKVKPSQFGGAVIGEVAFSPTGRAVILGYDPWQKTHARVFDSEGGRKWRSRGLPGGHRFSNGVRNVSPEAVVSTLDGLVAVGGFGDLGKGPRPKSTVIWGSANGAKWSQLATIKDAAPADLANGPNGLILAGQRLLRKGDLVPTVWRSRDGITWRKQRLEREGPPPQVVAVSPDGVELVLGVKYRADGSFWRRLWRSQDGEDWGRVDLPGDMAEDARISVLGPMATPRGFLLAIREQEHIIDTLWHSADGLAWEVVPMPQDWSLDRSWILAQPWPWRSLIHGARSLKGMTGQPSLLLTADGGLTWCRSDGPRKPGSYAFGAAMGPEGRLVLAGGRKFGKSGAWLVEPGTALDPEANGMMVPCEPAPLTQVHD